MTKVYWFKSKMYGLGWTPATWQGWVVVLLFVSLLLVISEYAPSQGAAIIGLLITVFSLLVICFIKGEKLSWRWGPQK